MKKILLTIFMVLCLFTLIGCDARSMDLAKNINGSTTNLMDSISGLDNVSLTDISKLKPTTENKFNTNAINNNNNVNQINNNTN